MATLEEEWQKILNEPGELQRGRDQLKRDLFNAMFVFAQSASMSFTVERLETLSWQLRWLIVEADRLKELIAEYYNNDKENIIK
ncbi:MAG: hypothetical protein IJG38_07535 [Thermoguttaceae bacterium]|nr:hypothetical protein [Thermoguttaceae bacterium]